MTDLELQKMGIISDPTPISPNRYWCNTTQTNIVIQKGLEIDDLIEIIFKIGILQGNQEGKQKRSNEFKALINNLP
jgi:hypothetical protein